MVAFDLQNLADGKKGQSERDVRYACRTIRIKGICGESGYLEIIYDSVSQTRLFVNKP